MRVAIFTDSYKPYLSGVVRSIETFSEEMSKLGCQYTIYAPSYPGVLRESNVFRFPSIPSLSNTGFYLALPLAPGLKAHLEQNPPDIIHVQSPFILGRVGAKYARKLKVPLVFTYHTLYDQYTHYVPFAKGISKDITRRLCTEFCNRCDLVITPTDIIAQHIKGMGVKTTVKWVPTGIRTEEFTGVDRNWLRQRYGISKEETLLLFVSRLGKEKNVYFLIDSFAEIVKHCLEPVRMLLVGEGPEGEKLKEYCFSRGLSDKVIFTGKLDRGDLIRVFCGADIFVFSSMTETQGIVLGEAKAAGLPIVAINAFGASNMVADEDDGFLVPNDIKAFTTKVNKLIQEPELRRRMSQRALENARDISVQSCALRLKDYYKELLNSFGKENIWSAAP